MITDSHDTEDRILALGREGLARPEILASLGMTAAEAEAREAADEAFAQAMQRAELAAQAWWGALQREALSSGVRLGNGAWREAVRWRFGEAGLERGASAAGDEAAEEEAPRVTFHIPDNGRRRGPDGRAPCDDPVWSRQHDLDGVEDEIADILEEMNRLTENLAVALQRKAEIEASGYEDYE